MKSTQGNFLSQVVEDPTRRGVLLDLMLTTREGLFGDGEVEDSLGHGTVEFSIG